MYYKCILTIHTVTLYFSTLTSSSAINLNSVILKIKNQMAFTVVPHKKMFNKTLVSDSTEYESGIEKFWRWTVVMIAKQCECT